MLLSRVFLALLLLLTGSLALADSIDINLNNSAAQLKYNASASGIGDGNAEIQGGVLLNDTNDMLSEVGLMILSPGGEEGGLSAGGGLKGVYAKQTQNGTTNNFAVIAVGAHVDYTLPGTTPISLVGEYFGSPKIISFADAERFNQYGIRLELAASPQAKIYLGYREIGFGIKATGSIIFDMGTHVGMVISF